MESPVYTVNLNHAVDLADACRGALRLARLANAPDGGDKELRAYIDYTSERFAKIAAERDALAVRATGLQLTLDETRRERDELSGMVDACEEANEELIGRLREATDKLTAYENHTDHQYLDALATRLYRERDAAEAKLAASETRLCLLAEKLAQCRKTEAVFLRRYVDMKAAITDAYFLTQEDSTNGK